MLQQEKETFFRAQSWVKIKKNTLHRSIVLKVIYSQQHKFFSQICAVSLVLTMLFPKCRYATSVISVKLVI